MRSLTLAALAAVAFLAAPVHASPDHAVCGGSISLTSCTGDLFRPCGPLVACP